MSTSFIFRTSNGQSYQFSWHNKLSAWSAKPGIYCFGRPSAGLLQSPSIYYVGQTDSFHNRLPCHERWDEAVRRGATMVAAVIVENALVRDYIEREMIQQLQPVLNQQLRAGIGLFSYR